MDRPGLLRPRENPGGGLLAAGGGVAIGEFGASGEIAGEGGCRRGEVWVAVTVSRGMWEVIVAGVSGRGSVLAQVVV